MYDFLPALMSFDHDWNNYGKFVDKLYDVFKHALHVSVKYWSYLEGNNFIRHYAWLETLNYVVILEEKQKPNKMFLVTAFCVDSAWKKKDLLKKYDNRNAR